MAPGSLVGISVSKSPLLKGRFMGILLGRAVLANVLIRRPRVAVRLARFSVRTLRVRGLLVVGGERNL